MERTIKDRTYSVKRFPNVGYVFWLLNPAIMINELILGQRIPQETLVETDVPSGTLPKEYVECSECGQLTDLELWPQVGKKFGNWFGLACPTCGSKLPTSLNVWSRLCVIILFPLVFFLKAKFQDRALSQQVLILRGSEPQRASAKGAQKVIKRGVLFGAAMAVVLFFASLAELGSMSPSIIIGLVGGGASGLLFGGLMYFFAHKI